MGIFGIKNNKFQEYVSDVYRNSQELKERLNPTIEKSEDRVRMARFCRMIAAICAVAAVAYIILFCFQIDLF